jgi:putative hemolysin
MLWVIAISTFLLGVLLNGLFAGYETGFYSADRIRIRHKAEEENDSKATTLLKELESPDKMLTTVLVGTNISLIFGTLALTRQLEGSPGWLAPLIATPMYLVFAEIIPKSIFRRHPNRLSLSLLPTIRFFEFLLAPLIYPTLWLVIGMRRMAGVRGEEANPIMSSEEDIRNLVDESAAKGSIEKEEQEMIHSVMDLQRTQAKGIMVPRIDIKALPKTASRKELIELFKESGLTRIPIYDGSIDTILGVANAYDVLLDHSEEKEGIEQFAREVNHVPDTKPVDDLLQELKGTAQHMAIVTDEYGGTDGLITLEDVLEEIFGEIHDEHDQAHDRIKQLGPRNFVVDARMTLEEVSDSIGYELEDIEVETIAGWVMHLAGRIPMQGEKLKTDGFRITILEAQGSRIVKVRLDISDD